MDTDAGFFDHLGEKPKSYGETIGDFITAFIFPNVLKINEREERYQQASRNVHVAFALAAYRSEHGRYPAKLDELAPKYIEAIPDDLYSGKPLIYRLEGKGYLLYSVGPDGKDDGGRGSEDEPRGDDIAIRMPVPEPKIK